MAQGAPDQGQRDCAADPASTETPSDALFDRAPLFDQAMSRLGPFEPAPVLAVAVSGGADSLALTLLADRWARARKGAVIGLTVDHRLRPDSAAEAETVAHILGAHGIRHESLVWHGPYPLHDLQAAARAARYRLLGFWCREHSVLHLLTAHHQDDQAETLLLRLGRGSGLAGLAGMAPIAEAGPVRLLRPLLESPAARLRRMLMDIGQDWIEDPSNRNEAFARIRLRRLAPRLEACGLTAPRLADTCKHLGRARRALEHDTDRLLAHAVELHPGGFALLDPAPLAAAPDEIRLRALAALIASIGGAPYPPRFDRLERLAAALAEGGLGRGKTLGFCQLRPWRGRILVYREQGAIAPAASVPDQDALLWDDRFLVRHRGALAVPLQIGAVGAADSAVLRAIVPASMAHHLPFEAWPSLPAFRQGATLVVVPHLEWQRPGKRLDIEIRLRLTRPLSSSGYAVV
jgi:tRNA(Ile)-lysidine synthase